MTTTSYTHPLQTPNGWIEEKIPLSTKLILQAAESLGITWEPIKGTRILKLSYRDHVELFRYQIPAGTSEMAFYACLDKGVTKHFLASAGVKTPFGFKLEQGSDEAMWMAAFEAVPKPLVVKPSHGQQGRSIFVGITTPEAYKKAVADAFAFTTEEGAGVMVEQQFVGSEYRVLTTHEKVLAVMYREPANVIGDGVKTLRQLIDEKNADPRRGTDLNYALFKIEYDQALDQYLAEQNLKLESVPAAGTKVYLRKVSNISQGGDSIDITDEVHPSVKEIAVRAVQAIPGLKIAGVDFMTKDIYSPQDENTYIIVEMNSSPGLCIHEQPFKGQARHTDREFVLLMFPELKTQQSEA